MFKPGNIFRTLTKIYLSHRQLKYIRLKKYLVEKKIHKGGWLKEMRDDINCNWMSRVQKLVAKGAIILNSALWDPFR